MHFLASVALLQAVSVFVPTVVAEELNAADVPTACTTVCQPVVQLTNTCDIDPEESTNKRLRLRADSGSSSDDDDEGSTEADEPIEAQCICTNTSFNVASVAALCASCIAQNGQTTKDMNKIMSQCSFSSTTYVPSATSAVASITVVATKPAVAAVSTTSSSKLATTTASMNNSGSARGPSTILGSSIAAIGIVCVAVLAL